MTSIKNARLIATEIPGLRHRVKTKLTTVMQEADRFGVGVETIRRAVRGETFRFVKEGLEPVEEVTYGRRATDPAIPPEEINKSLERLRELQTSSVEDGGRGAVDLFINQRKKDQ